MKTIADLEIKVTEMFGNVYVGVDNKGHVFLQSGKTIRYTKKMVRETAWSQSSLIEPLEFESTYSRFAKFCHRLNNDQLEHVAHYERSRANETGEEVHEAYASIADGEITCRKISIF